MTRQGARSWSRAATVAAASGHYYEQCAERAPSKAATRDLARTLWERSEAWLAGAGTAGQG